MFLFSFFQSTPYYFFISLFPFPIHPLNSTSTAHNQPSTFTLDSRFHGPRYTMSLRALRLLPTLPLKSCHSRHFTSIRSSLYGARALLERLSATPPPPSPSQSQPFHHGLPQYVLLNHRNTRALSSKDASLVGSEQSQDQHPSLVYEGPFASLTLKLKRVSLISACIGLVGLPAISLFGASSVPATGQLAIIATAGVTAIGSTALLGYCFSPYVHTLERLSALKDSNDGDANALVRIITRDILARRIETIFDPTTDVSPPPKNNSRPFCNFVVKGLPMYVHPELIDDYKLRVQLLGEEPQQANADARNKKKLEDDEFL